MNKKQADLIQSAIDQLKMKRRFQFLIGDIAYRARNQELYEYYRNEFYMSQEEMAAIDVLILP